MGEGTKAAIVAALLVTPAVANFLSENVANLFQFDRGGVAAGQFWRVFACHWTHWSLDHLLWDAATFAVLAFACYLRCPARLARTLILAAVAIPAAVWVATPGVGTYRGLSGLVSAMAVLLVVDGIQRSHETVWRWALAVVLAGFAAKIGFELLTGHAVFVDSAAAGFVPVPLAHAVGGIVGAAIGAAPQFRASRGRAAGLSCAN